MRRTEHSSRRARSLRRLAIAAVLCLLGVDAARAECPRANDIRSFLASQPLDRASRTSRFQIPVPTDLYRQALARPATPIPRRTKSLVQGVMLVELPVESLWKAINDDHHHAQGGYLPLRASEVVKGERGRSGREVFQYYVKAGFGRWWVNRLEMNDELYRSSNGTLWELRWHDVLEDYHDAGPPVEMSTAVRSIEEAHGAWLLTNLGGSCTLIEYVADGEPGGFVGAVQWLALTRTMRHTMRGIVDIATEHLAEPHSIDAFVRPDGAALEAPGDGR